MAQTQHTMRHPEKDMVPKPLVYAMFALMLGALAMVTYAQVTDRPNEGVLIEAPVVVERSVFLTADATGVYTVTDAATGEVIALSSDDRAGFAGVMGLVIKRHRSVLGLTNTDPVRVVRRTNGHVAVIDDATGMVTELIGYGADNVAVFARMVD